jgi:hypothetical protein
MYATNESAPPRRSLLRKILLRSWEYRYRRVFWGLRIAIGVFYLGFGLLLFAYGSWWGLLALAGSAAAFLFGYWIYQATRSQPAAS